MAEGHTFLPAEYFHAAWWKGQDGGFEVGDWNDLLPEETPYRRGISNAITADGQFILFSSFLHPSPSPDSPAPYGLAVVAQVAYDASGRPRAIEKLWLLDAVDSAGGTISATNAEAISDGWRTDPSGAIVRVIRVAGWYGIGWSSESYGPFGFLWELDVATETIATVNLNPYEMELDRYSDARGVNANGEMALNLTSLDVSGSQAHFWSGDLSEPPISIGTFGGQRAYVWAIADSGHMVGWAQTPNATAAFLWHSETGLQDLNALVQTKTTLSRGMAINGPGQILASGGSTYYLLTPLP